MDPVKPKSIKITRLYPPQRISRKLLAASALIIACLLGGIVYLLVTSKNKQSQNEEQITLTNREHEASSTKRANASGENLLRPTPTPQKVSIPETQVGTATPSVADADPVDFMSQRMIGLSLHQLSESDVLVTGECPNHLHKVRIDNQLYYTDRLGAINHPGFRLVNDVYYLIYRSQDNELVGLAALREEDGSVLRIVGLNGERGPRGDKVKIENKRGKSLVFFEGHTEQYELKGVALPLYGEGACGEASLFYLKLSHDSLLLAPNVEALEEYFLSK